LAAFAILTVSGGLAMMRASGAALASGFICAFVSASARAESPVERGRYLVSVTGCNDCHTPGGMLGSPDKTRVLAGSDVGFGDPASGVWVGGNLTPDKETGLGKWSGDQIVVALTKGKTPDGRSLSEIMPWPAFSHLTEKDVRAIAAYLKSLPAVKNAVPGPFKPGEAPSVAVSVIVPPSVFAKLPNPLPAK
jgi:mono/diheme cytochrome c family protein